MNLAIRYMCSPWTTFVVDDDTARGTRGSER